MDSESRHIGWKWMSVEIIKRNIDKIFKKYFIYNKNVKYIPKNIRFME